MSIIFSQASGFISCLFLHSKKSIPSAEIIYLVPVRENIGVWIASPALHPIYI
jgi:hypothetical protein